MDHQIAMDCARENAHASIVFKHEVAAPGRASSMIRSRCLMGACCWRFTMPGT